jgi:hypothetical protein
LAAHREYQKHRRTGALLAAREKLYVCSNKTCPAAAAVDCAGWLIELEAAIPTLVFDIKKNGASAPEARVYVDEVPFTGWSAGAALQVDPGQHTVRFELPPFEPIRDSVLVGEGMRLRVVSADFRDKPVAAPTAPARPTSPGTSPARPEPAPVYSTSRPVPGLVYPLLGLSAAGFAAFAGFGVAGRARQDKLDKECVPDCTDEDLRGMRSFYTAADVGLVIGGLAFAGAGVVYLTRPEKHEPSVAVAPSAFGSGFGASLVIRHF